MKAATVSASVVVFTMILASIAQADLDWGKQCRRPALIQSSKEFWLAKGSNEELLSIPKGIVDAHLSLHANNHVAITILDARSEEVIMTWPAPSAKRDMPLCVDFAETRVCQIFTVENDGAVRGTVDFEDELPADVILKGHSVQQKLTDFKLAWTWLPSTSACCFAEETCIDSGVAKLRKGATTIVGEVAPAKAQAGLFLKNIQPTETVMLFMSDAETPFHTWSLKGQDTYHDNCTVHEGTPYCYNAANGHLMLESPLNTSIRVEVLAKRTRELSVEAKWMEPSLECVDAIVRGVQGQVCFPKAHECFDSENSLIQCHTDAVSEQCNPKNENSIQWPSCAGGAFYCHCHEEDDDDDQEVCVGSRTFGNRCEAQCLLGASPPGLKPGKCKEQTAALMQSTAVCDCDKSLRPICISGHTYANLCLAKCALPKRQVSTARPGPCDAASVDVVAMFSDPEDATTAAPTKKTARAVATTPSSSSSTSSSSSSCQCDKFGRARPGALGEGIAVCVRARTFTDMCTAMCEIGTREAMSASVGACGTRGSRGAMCGFAAGKAPSPPACADGLVCAPAAEDATLGTCQTNVCADMMCPNGFACVVNNFGCDKDACPACILI